MNQPLPLDPETAAEGPGSDAGSGPGGSPWQWSLTRWALPREVASRVIFMMVGAILEENTPALFLQPS